MAAEGRPLSAQRPVIRLQSWQSDPFRASGPLHSTLVMNNSLIYVPLFGIANGRVQSETIARISSASSAIINGFQIYVLKWALLRYLRLCQVPDGLKSFRWSPPAAARWHTWTAVSHVTEGTKTRDVRENTNTADSMTPQQGFVIPPLDSPRKQVKSCFGRRHDKDTQIIDKGPKNSGYANCRRLRVKWVSLSFWVPPCLS